MNIRPEHPNPQFERENWINLNGEWQFAFDFGKSGLDRKMFLADEETSQKYDKKILVPFCPESPLSGVGETDFLNSVWYKKNIEIKNKRVYINNEQVFFKGANRHDIHPQLGKAIPVESMIEDIVLFKQNNINTVRTAHYPNDAKMYAL